MRNLRSVLPPMDTLATFEAAARLQSFTMAANELCLTQAAVSRQIKLLEDNLKTQLFTRSHRAIKLTVEGKAFYSTVALAITHVANATTELRDKPEVHQLTIAADQSIAWLWLMPRLALFRKEFPEVNVRLIATDIKQDYLADGVDIAIVFGPEEWPGFSSELLFEEEIFPVCSPSFLDSNPIRKIEDLSSNALLELEDDQWGWVNWRMWLTEQGVRSSTQIQPILINNYPLILESAKNGLGVALGWNHLVDDMLNRNELIVPLDINYRSEKGYYLLARHIDPISSSLSCFKDWVFAEMSKSVA